MTDNLDIPKFLLRPDTPESKAARELLNLELKKGTAMSIGPKEQALRDSRLTEADKKAIAELSNGQAQKKATQTSNRIAKMKAKKNGESAKMPAQGKDALKVIAEKELKADNDKLASAFNSSLGKKAILQFKGGEPSKEQVEKRAKELAAKKLPETTASLADLPAKELKKHAPKEAAKPVVKKGKGKSLTEKARDALMTKKGATREQLMKLTGWKAINIKKLVPKGKKLSQDGDCFRIA